jgi:hypothetical protein
MPLDHQARAIRAWPVLVALARKRGEPMSYGELCARLRLHHRAAAPLLNLIQDFCARERLPPLQALVVNARTRLPGAGSSGSGSTAASHRRALERVYRHEAWPATPRLGAPG